MLPLKKASRDLLLPMLEHHAPHLVAQAFNPNIQTYTRDFYTKLQCAVADEFHARGLREDYEPNEYGHECEALIDELGWLAEGWTTGSFEEFERDVMTWIAKETPQYEQQILSQYNSCRIKNAASPVTNSSPILKLRTHPTAWATLTKHSAPSVSTSTACSTERDIFCS